ncbi:renal dipeptidase family [Podospora australis]|uniref:Dipeptidase n=1 Tax=Podospora australis TaxID=1536484 RepID=A0AAN6WM90_9PEZI|nr:renal dipeptidase family [Podospora australis]
MESDDLYVAKARDLLRQAPLIDGHNDFPYILRGWYGINTTEPSFNVNDMPIGQTDLTRLRKGGVGGQFWSAFVPCPKDDTEISKLRVLRDTLQQIDLIHQVISSNSGDLHFSHDSDSVWRAFQSGRIASLLGVEGLHQLGGSFSALRLFHRLGVRYITLCHDQHSEFVDSSSPSQPLHGGLSQLGEAVIREMNRVGIIIDLSHTSHDAQRQVLKISRAPVIFSHSSVYALQPHHRNAPDDVLDMIKENNGVVMICFLPSLSSITTEGAGKVPASVKTVAEHIMYVGQRIGYERVGIGSDFDGMLEGPEGLDDVGDYPKLVAELLRNNVGEADLKAVLGGNILRVLDHVRDEAERQQKAGVEAQVSDEVRGVWTDAQREMLAKKGAERGLLPMGSKSADL